MAATWERKAQAVISKTIAHLRRDIESGQISEAEPRRILAKKYPFGECAHHPYSVWRRCVNEAIADAFSDEQQLDLFA